MYDTKKTKVNGKRGPRGCLIYGIILFLGLPFLLLAIGALIFFGRERSARSELNARIDEIRRQGLPVDNRSMQDYHERLTTDEHTEEWIAILDELTGEEFSESCKGVPIFDGQIEEQIPSPGEEWAAERTTRRFMAKWFRVHDRISRLSRDQLKEGAKPIRFPIKFESVATLLPHTQNMRQAARLLLLRTQLAIHDRDSSSVRRGIEALIGNAELLRGEPILVSQLVSLAIDGMAMNTLQSAIRHNVLEQDDLERLLDLMRGRFDLTDAWQVSMQGERAMMLPIFDDPGSVSGESIPNIPGRSRDALYYMDYIDGALAAPTEDFDKFMAALNEQEEFLQQLSVGSVFQRLDSVLTNMMAPATAAGGSAFVRQATQHRIAAMAIGIRLYEMKHGRFPSSLEDLAEFQLDPAIHAPPGGKPFGYVVDAESGQATVWGFNLREVSSTPEEIPVVEEGEPYADYNRIWIWEFIPSASLDPANKPLTSEAKEGVVKEGAKQP